MKWQLIPFILFVVMVLAFAGYITRQNRDGGLPSQPLVGQNISAFTLPTLDDKTFDTQKLPKDRFTLINLFASWCVACAVEHPFLIELSQNKKLSLVGIAWNDKAPATKAYLEKNHNPFNSIALDDQGITGIHLAITGVPETILISPQGVILARYAGPLTEDVWNDHFVGKLQ